MNYSYIKSGKRTLAVASWKQYIEVLDWNVHNDSVYSLKYYHIPSDTGVVKERKELKLVQQCFSIDLTDFIWMDNNVTLTQDRGVSQHENKNHGVSITNN